MRKKHRPVSNINVTPMVDVMLVLLIVFMVTAPLLTVGVPVNLPKVEANSLDAQKEPLEISINENNEIYLGEELIPFDELILKVKTIAGSNTDIRIFLRADTTINYGEVMKVLGALNAGQDSNIDSQTKQYFTKMVRDLYFQSLDERNARLSGAKRLNRAGYDKNMMRSFISHAKAEAALIAQMENGAAINTALQEAAKETKSEGNLRDDEKNQAFVLVTQHYKQMLKGDETPIQDRINAANSVYMLLTSVGYHVTNATQPTMVTVPRVAGDFGDYTGAWNGLTTVSYTHLTLPTKRIV